MDIGFDDETRGKMAWTLPNEAAQLMQNTPQDKQQQVVAVLQNSMGIMALFLMRSMNSPRLASYLESLVNMMSDLATLDAAQQQQQQEQ